MKRLNNDKCEVNIKFSSDIDPKTGNKYRWDYKFLNDRFGGKKDPEAVKKIWVCGPPLMNESFDKALEKIFGDRFP